MKTKYICNRWKAACEVRKALENFIVNEILRIRLHYLFELLIVKMNAYDASGGYRDLS